MSNLVDKVKFQILLDDTFASFCIDTSLSPIEKKKVLSVINDFDNGSWRYSKFQSFIWDNIKETALSARERAALIDQEHSTLIEAAKKLRLTEADAIGQGSELAEVVLYGIMKYHFNALPVVPKIFYKQNARDNAKGADSVHIVVKDGDFTIWFGEAKFYNDIKDARLGTIVQSVENALTKEKIDLENSIISNVRDLEELVEDVDLRISILAAIAAGVSQDSVKPKLNIPILLLHECEITQAATSLTEEYRSDILAYHKARAESYFSKQIKKFGSSLWMYSEITFHVILFPVPKKDEIIEKFVQNVEFYKNQ